MGCAIPSRIHSHRVRQGNPPQLSLDRMNRTSSGILALAVIACPTAARAQDTTAVDTSYVEYSDSPISLPLGVGLRIPTYDRVNGVTLPWGPKIETSNGRIDLDALVRYRSEEHTSELQSQFHLVCRLLLEKKKQ